MREVLLKSQSGAREPSSTTQAETSHNKALGIFSATSHKEGLKHCVVRVVINADDHLPPHPAYAIISPTEQLKGSVTNKTPPLQQ